MIHIDDKGYIVQSKLYIMTCNHIIQWDSNNYGIGILHVSNIMRIDLNLTVFKELTLM